MVQRNCIALLRKFLLKETTVFLGEFFTLIHEDVTKAIKTTWFSGMEIQYLKWDMVQKKINAVAGKREDDF